MDIKKELQDLCDRYKAEAEKILERAKTEKKAWKPEAHENYWFVSGNGAVCRSSWNPEAFQHRGRYAIGNCYQTEEEAEFAVEKLKVIAELKRFAEEHNENIDWDDGNKAKYYFYYNVAIHKIGIETNYFCAIPAIYFSSEEIAKAAIEAIGEERLKKYYFEVEG